MLLNQLFEAITRTGKGDTAVVGWGRGMGHKGHMMLASSVVTKAKEAGGDPYFVVSRTVGKDDPITPEEKLAIYKKVFPEQGHIFQAASDEIPDLTKVLANLNKQGYKNAVVVVGADQVKAFQYLKNYNGKPNKAGDIPFTFDNLDVISRQETNDPSKDQEGPRATPMRQVLNDPNKSEEEQFAVWRDAMSPELSDDEVRDLMAKAKTRMAGFAKPKKEGVAESEYGIPDETPGHLPGGPKMTFGEFKKMWPGVILKRPSGGSLAGSVVADVEGWMNNPKSVWEPLKGMAEGISIVDQDSDLDQEVFTLNVDGNKVSFTYWDYETNFQHPDIKDIYQQAKEQLGKKLSPEQIKDVARTVFKSFEQGVAEGFVFLSPKEKGHIQNVTSKLSDIPGMWDHAEQTFTPAGLEQLKKVLQNDKYVKYAVNLKADDFDEGMDEAAPTLVKGVAGAAGGAALGGAAALTAMVFIPFVPGSPAIAAIVGGLKGAQMGAAAADMAWDKISKIFGGEDKAEAAAMAHAQAAKAGEKTFSYNGKEYPVKLKPQQADSAAKEIQSLGERVQEGRKKKAKKRYKVRYGYGGGVDTGGDGGGMGEAKQRLDPKCWTGYRKQGTKMKGGKRVNNCVKIGEGWESIMDDAISKLLKGSK